MNSIILSGMAWATSLKDAVMHWVREEAGQDIVEYAVIVGGIGILAAVALIATDGGAWLTDAFDSAKTQIADCIQFNATCGNGG